MKLKKTLALLAAATMLLCGCSSGTGSAGSTASGAQDSGEPVEVVVWHTFSEHQLDAFDAIVEAYNASQSAVKVVSQAQPYNDYDQ